MKAFSSVLQALTVIHVLSTTSTVAAACNADNCLRALFPTASPTALSSALSFCATYTTTINTATTGFPTRATAACGTSASRYSSACSCTPTSTTATTTATPSCTPTPAANLIQNGGFECGLAPWVAQDKANTTHALTSPGDTGAFAYQFNQVGAIDPDTNMHPASVNQNFTATSGNSYELTFRSYFDYCGDGFTGVMINHAAVYTVDACDHGPAGVYYTNTVDFTAGANPQNLRFEFIISASEPRAVAKIDNVVVVAK